MPDALISALAMPGLIWVAMAALVGGVVRGFSGFGTGMIYLPVAAQVLPPFWAILTLVMMDLFGPVPNLRRAWRDAHKADLARLALGALALLPLGLLVLSLIQPQSFRYAVSFLALGLLVCLVLGLRWRGTLRPPLVFAIGGVSGFLGGLTGLAGPPVILTYLASPHGPAVIRANTMLHLFFFDILLIAMIGARGELNWTPVVIGLMMAVPNILGNMIGAAIFDPERESLYRAVAYGVIAVSAISGLPLWD